MLSLRPKTNYNRNMIIEGETNNFTTLQLKTFYDKLLELQISESYFLEEYCNNNYILTIDVFSIINKYKEEYLEFKIEKLINEELLTISELYFSWNQNFPEKIIFISKEKNVLNFRKFQAFTPNADIYLRLKNKFSLGNYICIIEKNTADDLFEIDLNPSFKEEVLFEKHYLVNKKDESILSYLLNNKDKTLKIKSSSYSGVDKKELTLKNFLDGYKEEYTYTIGY